MLTLYYWCFFMWKKVVFYVGVIISLWIQFIMIMFLSKQLLKITILSNKFYIYLKSNFRFINIFIFEQRLIINMFFETK